MNLFLFLLLFLFIISIAGYLFVRWKHQHWKRFKIPYIVPEFFYGNSRGMNKKFPNSFFARDMYLKHKSKGPIFGVYIYTEPFVIVTDPELIKTIFIKEFNTFQGRGDYHNEKDDPVSGSVATVAGERWKSLRSKFSPIFSSGKLKMMFPIISVIADEFIKRISIEQNVKGSLEVKDISSRYTTDIIARTAFGIECNSLENPNNEFYKTAKSAIVKLNFMKRILIANYPNLARKLHIKSIDPNIANFYRNVVEKMLEQRKQNKIERNDFLNLLMNSGMTFNEIWTQSVVFFIAGFESTSTVLSFTLFELSQDENIQSNARKCVRKNLEKFNGEFCYDAVLEMQYIDLCVKEALRKYPPFSAARRMAYKDFQLPNSEKIFPKGTNILIPIFGIHQDPEMYPNPQNFDPDRFSPEETSKRDPFTFIPFGGGLRNCVGERFAMIKIKLTLAKILINYKFSLNKSKTLVPLEFSNSLVLTPKSGIYINFEKL